ncbi:MFS transporter [Streptomyces sp. NPDC002573]|uniref:MFS transporter n=1 Tax=Streptomyces sp. NPDC002573 TaxID=3364651 RepID=UPI0036B0E3FA
MEPGHAPPDAKYRTVTRPRGLELRPHRRQRPLPDRWSAVLHAGGSPASPPSGARTRHRRSGCAGPGCRGGSSGRQDRPQEFRAHLRAVTNVGISLGAVGAGWVVQVGTLDAYQLMVIGNAIAFVVSAALLVRLPPVTPVPTMGGPRWTALRDRPYLLLTVLDGIMAIQFKVLTVAIPLWLVGAPSAPHRLISGTMLTGTVIVVAFQVRVGRGIDSPAAGGHAYRRAGVAFLVSCSMISLSTGTTAWAATALLITAVVIHTVGELWHPAAGFEVPFALAPRHATGQYLGVFGLGAGLAEALGPGLLI